MKFIAFDLETTGIKPQIDAIVEIGAVLFEGNQPQKSYGTLINPGIPIPKEASSVHGITDEMVREKPSVEEVLADFAHFCGSLPLVAHNAPFDFKFLLKEITQHRSLAPSGVVLDTLPLARRTFPGLPNYRLGTLVTYFKFPSGTFHRAEEDSAYCGRLFAKIIETLEMRGERSTEENLIRISGKKALSFPQYKNQSHQMDLF